MGQRGPLRQEGLKRRVSRERAIEAATVVVETGQIHEAPFDPDPKWHPVAAAIYESFEESGQSALFQPSDWTKLYLLCENLSRELHPQFVGFAETYEEFEVDGKKHLMPVKKPISGPLPMKGASVTAAQAIMASLGMSYGDRQRLNIELKAAATGPATDPVKDAMADLVEAMKNGGNVVPFERPASGD